QKLPDLSFDLNTINCSLDNSEIQLTVPIATDNCETAIVGTLSAPEKYFIGNNTIYWTFTDSAGNSSQCPQNIIVTDLFAPYFDCQKLPDLSFDLNTINCSLDSSEIQLTAPIATDNCETAIVGTLSAPKEYFIGNNMIYWTFTDSAGNTSQCTQTIIVLDKSAPVVNCNYIVPLTYNLFTSDCGINSQLLNIQTPYAIDNCESIVVGHADIPDYFEIGDHTIDWHFTDIYGNESSCSQSVTIADYYAPVVQPDAETILYITLPLNANDISSDEIELPTLFATDNCDERIEGDVIIPTNFFIGDNSILWTFRDDYGNVSYFPQIVFAIKQFELAIYPNPVHETLYIAGLESDEEITLYNTIGQNIYQTKSTGNPTTIDMTNYTDNLYFIFIRNQYYKIIRK
ncbi:MAG: HYR domain-containing protein, partial [Bacteroidales bacterium]|nr:HYR domain-containing protein [Bacteroidales bacterium]